jgi:hypothetical protein
VSGCNTFQVALKSWTGKYVKAELTAELHETVEATSNQVSAFGETFTVEELATDDEGHFKIKLKSIFGTYLDAEIEENEPDYKISLSQNPTIFTVVPGLMPMTTIEDGRYALKTADGRYVTADGDGYLKAQWTSASTWESFTPKCVSGICIFH